MRGRMIVAFVSGLVFALGLAIAGMTDPMKVIGFLDIAGAWDPSLAFVMGGAVLVYGLLSRFISRRDAPLLDARFFLPTRRDIDARLVAGAALFGIGWGLSGYCPGPALVSTMSFGTSVLAFTAAMLTGMALFSVGERTHNRR